MILELKNVFLNEGSKKNFEYSFSMSDIDINGDYPFVSPVMVKGEAQNRAGLVDISFDVSFTYKRPCDRCFVDATRSLNYRFAHRLVSSLAGGENDDYIEVPDYTLDIDELVASDIILDLPVKFLCKDDCKGICYKCGKNLNHGECDCSYEEIDPRLEALKELLK
ncbi:MAG: DUF177 domain-containing protein [Oscillospiraceae bacterium]|nr:DUF177 domain-containing protein [Oscillospiraceae bacterium]